MAYELKSLQERLDKAGMPIAEDMIEKVVSETLDWIAEESIKDGKGYIGAVIGALKPAVMDALDHIDGKVGQ